MKKKFLSIVLAMAMSFGTFGALVGCDKEPTYKTGDIEDKSTIKVLISNMRPTMKSIELHFGATANLIGKGDLQGTEIIDNNWEDLLADFESKSVDQCAVYQFLSTNPKNDTQNRISGYFTFTRDNLAYDGEFLEQSNKKVTFEEIKEKYKDCAVKPGIDAWNMFDLIIPVYSTEIKLLGNLAIYSENDFYKTETGYSLSVDPFEDEVLVTKLLAEADTLVNEIDIEQTTLSKLIEKPQVSKLLQTLLNGITEKEFCGVIHYSMGDTEQKRPLPAPKDGQSAFDYLKTLLNDKEFYKAMSDGGDGVIGTMTLNQLFNLETTNEEFRQNWKEHKDEMKANLMESFGKGIPGSLALSENGEVTDQKFVFEFLFDENKKLSKVELSYRGKVCDLIEGEEYEGSFEIKMEIVPGEGKLALRDMSKAEIVEPSHERPSQEEQGGESSNEGSS